jgi:hypothetical protein
LSEFWLGDLDGKPQVFEAAHQPFGRARPIKLIEIFGPQVLVDLSTHLRDE